MDDMGHMDDETPTRSALAGPLLTAVLVLAAAVLAVLVGLEVQAARTAPSGDASSAVPVDPAERAGLQALAARTGERVLTYRHDSFDRDVARASAGLTPDFADEYAATMDELRRDTLRDEIDQRATAVAAGVVSASDTRAEVLVFVNQQTTSAVTGASRSRRNRLVVSLVGDDGAWTVAGVTALG